MADESFAGEEQRFVAADASDAIVQAFGEGDDMAGVHDVSPVHINRDHAAKCVEPEIALPRTLDEEERFTGEKSFHQSLPLGLDGHARTRRDVRGVLQIDRVVLQIDVIQIAGCTGRDTDLAGAVLRSEFIDEHGFARDETSDAATHLGLHPEIGVHDRHRRGFHFDESRVR